MKRESAFARNPDSSITSKYTATSRPQRCWTRANKSMLLAFQPIAARLLLYPRSLGVAIICRGVMSLVFGGKHR